MSLRKPACGIILRNREPFRKGNGKNKEVIIMGKLLLTGVDGNLGNQAAEYLLELEQD